MMADAPEARERLSHPRHHQAVKPFSRRRQPFHRPWRNDAECHGSVVEDDATSREPSRDGDARIGAPAHVNIVRRRH
jgi:hypothetical protein